jgi:Subtilisin inhibitor-like
MRGVVTALLITAASAAFALPAINAANSAVLASTRPELLPAPPPDLAAAPPPGLLPAIAENPARAAATSRYQPRRPWGRTRLDLTVDQGSNARQARRAAFVACHPTSGSHPRAAQACRDLTSANGDFGALPGISPKQHCTMIYAPVTVTARGYWDNRPVSYRHTYPNACALRDRTGPVFDF